MSDTILYALDQGVATITFNRPDKLNAFTDPMLASLGKALREAARDEAVRCLVLTGAGRAFSAGQDLADVRERDAAGGMSFKEHLETTYNRAIAAITELEKPVIAAVNGVAAGAGASIALACDIRVMAEDARLIMAFAGVGLVPDSGSTWFLPRMMGYERAFELAATGGRVGAAEAVALGLAGRVVAPDALAATVEELARRLAQGPTKAIGLTKRAMRRALAGRLDDALAYEAQLQEIAGRTDDHREGVAAFLEKRPARFIGR